MGAVSIGSSVVLGPNGRIQQISGLKHKVLEQDLDLENNTPGNLFASTVVDANASVINDVFDYAPYGDYEVDANKEPIGLPERLEAVDIFPLSLAQASLELAKGEPSKFSTLAANNPPNPDNPFYESNPVECLQGWGT